MNNTKYFLLNGRTIVGKVIKTLNNKVLIKIDRFSDSDIDTNHPGFRKEMRKTIHRTCNPCFVNKLMIIEK